MKMQATSAIFIKIVFFFLFCRMTQAVSPSPDGGYPSGNTAEGQSALLGLTSGTYNTALGFFSLGSNTEGNFNTGVGAGTLLANTADNNTATGAGALLSNTSGTGNTANGAFALFSNAEGNSNTAVGVNALSKNTWNRNTAVGYSALFNTTGGLAGDNTAVGASALLNNTSGETNTGIGQGALFSNTTGSFNTAVGFIAGLSATDGNGNVYIGSGMLGVAGEENTTYIRNVYDSVAVTRQVYVNQENKIGTLASTRRVKDDIKPMDTFSEAIFALKPVTFRYKKEIDRARSLSFGLVAEEVAEIRPELVTRGRDGNPETVRYDAVNMMLLNEFLKAHRRMEEQQKQIDLLTAQLEQQAALIQKVSDELTLNRSTRQALAGQE